MPRIQKTNVTTGVAFTPVGVIQFFDGTATVSDKQLEYLRGKAGISVIGETMSPVAPPDPIVEPDPEPVVEEAPADPPDVAPIAEPEPVVEDIVEQIDPEKNTVVTDVKRSVGRTHKGK